ncbi:transaldolase family protein [Aggregatilinea lenta]|uniref:transaldolase family protein n=1 Tax=Aggregatilinea lenta TaxID=913108 RepID=UPI000E5C53D1|nr:transaldolase family protein [Aggregatilinea lenta]
MAIYLNSAFPEHARRAQELAFIDGVTTNPSLLAETGRPGLDVLAELLETFDGHVFYQVTGSTVEQRLDQAWEAHEMRPDKVVIKIPATTENMTLAHRLTDAGIEICVTAVSAPAQAYIAAQINAQFVAPYVNRLTRQMGDGLGVVRDIRRIVEGTPTEILAASLKTVDEAMAALLSGAHHITVALDLILAMGDHELSQLAIDEFNRAANVARG